MCLIVAASRVHADAPLIVAANRDELLARPASATSVLRDTPRTIGGRDDLAFGTWLAVNAHGVVAGLTNQRGPKRDASKRSRGELPLLCTAYPSAALAVAALEEQLRPRDYNACVLLVGDRRDLFYVELLDHDRPQVESLDPGIYVLENRPLRADSPKSDLVRQRVAGLAGWSLSGLLSELTPVLASEDIPPRALAKALGDRPLALEAARVRTESYGTRSSSITVVPRVGGPQHWACDGPPDAAPFRDVSGLFG